MSRRSVVGARPVADHAQHEELLENDVKRTREPTHSIPLHDYRPAVQGAVSWLGDRYLLAEPVRRRVDEHKAWFSEPRRWHPARPVSVQ